MRWTKVALLTIGMLAAGVGCKKPAGTSTTGDIVLGEFASMTGGTASFGQAAHRGLVLAIEQANESGGVLGRKIVLKSEDDESNVDKAVTVVQKLISEDHVVAVIGEVASKRSIAGATVCQRYKIPMLSPASTNPAVTVEDGKTKAWIFRICFIDDFQGRADAKFAQEKGWKHIAMLTNEEEDYARGLARYFKEGFAAGGGQISLEVSYNNSTKDFQSQIKRIADANPDAVYVPGYYEEMGLILQAAADRGLKVPFFGGDGWDSPSTLKLDVAQGDYYTDHFTAEDPNPHVQEFVKAFKKRYGEVPDAMDVLGYDAGKVMIDAIKRAGKTTPEAIRDALAATKDYPGASGTITIDDHHNARKPIVVLQIKDHKAQLVRTYTPEDLEKK